MKIAITYRDEGQGKGAFFDHFTLRAMTGVITETAVKKANAVNNFSDYLTNHPYGLPLNTAMPAVTQDASDAGFLFIPGYTRDSDEKQPASHTKRLDFEKKLIQQAKLRGQPILAVCAGSWTLWTSFKGKIRLVDDHNYGGAMPRMSKTEAKVCNNKMIHNVAPKAGTYLAGAIQSVQAFPVNSVHWKAPAKPSKRVSALVEVSGCSQQDDSIAPHSRQQTLMKPENCIEAFETRFGAPMMGIQWHPEAFNPTDPGAGTHQAIFSFMVKSGQTYLNRRRLNQEFTGLVSQSRATFFAHKEEFDDHLTPSRFLPAQSNG